MKETYILILIISCVLTVLLDWIVHLICDCTIGDFIAMFLFKVWDKFIWLFSPLWHPRLSIWCKKHGMNPWNTSIREILALNDSDFETWVNMIPKKRRKQWMLLRERNNK